ncbi:MAG: zinc transporter, partial [Alphaproteobacteria bacterium]
MRALAPILALLCLLAGAVRAEPPRVVADIAPLHSLVARIMQGVAQPQLLLPATASPHQLTLRPSQARMLARADLVFWVGPALTPWLSRSLDALAPDAGKVAMMAAPGVVVLPMRSDPEFADEDAEHANEHDGAADPHLWLDPVNAAAMLRAIAAALSDADPGNRALYEHNLARALAGNMRLQADLAALLAPLRGRPYLVAHDAYQYLERRFGLHPAGAIAPGEATAPGPARVAALRALIADGKIQCIFAEPQTPGRLIATVASDGNVTLATLDPLGAG